MKGPGVTQTMKPTHRRDEPTPETARPIGPETVAVRMFREVFAEDAHSARHLKVSLDRYLKLVLEAPNAKRSDKTYARKIHAELTQQYRGKEPKALPGWARGLEEPDISDQDIQEILSAADGSSSKKPGSRKRPI